MADKFSPTISTALPGYSKSAAIGENLGTGLGKGLQALLQHKMGQMIQERQDKKTAAGLQALLGVSPEDAKAMAPLDPKLLQTYITQHAASKQRNLQEEALRRAAGDGNQSNTPTDTKIDTGDYTGKSTAEIINSFPGRAAQQATDTSGLGPFVTAESLKLSATNRKEWSDKVDRSYKAVKDELETSRRTADIAEQDIKDARGFLYLSKTGQTISGRPKALIDNMGLGDFITNPGTQISEKFAAGMPLRYMSTLKNTGKVTDRMLKNIQAMFPGLTQSKEAAEALLKIKIADNKSKILINKKIQDLSSGFLRVNKPIPSNLFEIAKSQLKPELDKNANVQFKILSDMLINQVPEMGLKQNAFEGNTATLETGAKFIFRNGVWMPADEAFEG